MQLRVQATGAYCRECTIRIARIVVNTMSPKGNQVVINERQAAMRPATLDLCKHLPRFVPSTVLSLLLVISHFIIMSSYSVEEVTTRKDLDAIVDVIWAAMDGFDPSHQVFYPVFGDNATDRDTAIKTSKERVWQDHENDNSSHWVGAWDKVGGEVVGGCQWRIYEHNPYPDGTPKVEAVWWPEGEGRRFASEVVRQCYTPRMIWMARPHVGKSIGSSTISSV